MWPPTWACPRAGARSQPGLLGLLMVWTVMGGLLAMHALSTGHSSHTAMPTGTQHGAADVHSSGHHPTDSPRTGPFDRAQSAVGAAVASAVNGLSVGPSVVRADDAVVRGPAGQQAVRGPGITSAVLVGTRDEHAERVLGHELRPEWVPGHGPDAPTGTPLCQAILRGAGVVLLLLILSRLALATRGTAWVLARHPMSTADGHGRWRTWQCRLPVRGPSLQKLCISRT
ncbi:hypothetical protein [Kineosporia sp. NBRC 101731]|uniref:hypothetical protein n=1 Tax=Kineosporia sp. NBRC 101731 TaxID=3032199 RepID=UPI0025552DBE|nr:hypothetical protein [Kineosporia sp. NBRC 101731]